MKDSYEQIMLKNSKVGAKSIFLLMVIMLVFSQFSAAQQGVVAQRILEARAAGKMPKAPLKCSARKLLNIVGKGSDKNQYFGYDRGIIKQMVFADKAEHLSLAIPTHEGNLVLDLMRVHSKPIQVTTNNHESFTVAAPVAYRGIVRGQEDKSLSSLVFNREDESVNGFIALDGDYYAEIGKLKDDDHNAHYVHQVALSPEDGICGEDHQGEAEPNLGISFRRPLDSAESTRPCIGVQAVVDYGIYQREGATVAASVDFAARLFAQVFTAFANEDVTMTLNGVYVWTSPDPYGEGPLNSFKQDQSYPRGGDICHLIRSKTNGNVAGVANQGTICSRVGYSWAAAGGSTINTYPEYSAGVYYAAHELGHTMGNPHTFSANWNTDPDYERYDNNPNGSEVLGNVGIMGYAGHMFFTPQASDRMRMTIDGCPGNIYVGCNGNLVSFAENSTETVFTASMAGVSDPTYSLSGGVDQSLFSIGASGELTFMAPPDFENPMDANADNEYELEITATDLATGLVTLRALTVIVTNLDDPPPVFSSATTASFLENSTEIGYTAVATGAALPTYALLGGADVDLFNMNPTTGDLTFKAPPDFENPSDANADNTYELVITAIDAFNNFSELSLTITVDDIDENTPLFPLASDAIRVGENLPVGSTVYSTFAMDESVVTYGLSGADAGYFTIDEQDGAAVLRFNDSPDYELLNRYQINITATDAFGNFSELPLEIAINDIDEGVLESSEESDLAPSEESVLEPIDESVLEPIDEGILEPSTTADIAIYPNPTTGQFYIAGEEAENVKFVSVYSIGGKRVVGQLALSTEKAYDISELLPGLYLLLFSNESGVIFVGKVIRE